MIDTVQELNAVAKLRLLWAVVGERHWRTVVPTRSERDRAYMALVAAGLTCSRDEVDDGFVLEARCVA